MTKDFKRSEFISIHALREEGNLPQMDFKAFAVISIHALREEGDNTPIMWSFKEDAFLSTPSARRATDVLCIATGKISDFYPRPPRGGRRGQIEVADFDVHFYPRPPRGGRRHIAAVVQLPRRVFLSTPSARRATWWYLKVISI